MPLRPEDVDHVALLARIGLSEAEKEKLRPQLDAILDHIEALRAVAIDGVPETAQVTGLVNAWRDDAGRPGLSAAEALANAPESDGEHFVVGAIQE